MIVSVPLKLVSGSISPPVSSLVSEGSKTFSETIVINSYMIDDTRTGSLNVSSIISRSRSKEKCVSFGGTKSA